jgi:hypothetical protein
VEPPQATWTCSEKPRDDHAAPDWLTASEYQDSGSVLEAKCAQLATLIKARGRFISFCSMFSPF